RRGLADPPRQGRGDGGAGMMLAPASGDFMNDPIVWLEWTGLYMSPWKLIGLTGAAMFGGRWLVQFIASRRQRKPVIPRLFWYMSLLGSVMTLSYFVFSRKQDAVCLVQYKIPAYPAASSLAPDNP